MRCELCGKEAGKTRPVEVEGTVLSVCKECSRFGTGAKVTEGKKAKKPMPAKVRERLEARKRRMQERDLFSEEVFDLASDYPSRMRKGRQRKGLSQEDLAKKINEKISVIKKVEAGDLRPSEGLRKRIEKTLDISLIEKREAAPAQFDKNDPSRPMTLGDLIKREDD